MHYGICPLSIVPLRAEPKNTSEQTSQLLYGEFFTILDVRNSWAKILNENDKINLHLIGKLQTNKVKFCLKLFKFIHSLDSEKLAKKIADEQIKQKTKVKLFIQINIGNEQQKSGIYADQVENFYNFCTKLDLDIIGTMCIQPANEDPEKYFMRMMYLNKKLGLKEISMGMSSDYQEAIKFNSTYLRIGSNIFGKRD